MSIKHEVVSGLQFGDEQDRGSEAQPDIAGSLPGTQNVYCLPARSKTIRPSLAPLWRAKGDCPRDRVDAVIRRDIESTVQAK